MTRDCVEEVIRFNEESERFDGLSVEQLLYAAILGAGLSDVKFVLENTDWGMIMIGEFE